MHSAKIVEVDRQIYTAEFDEPGQTAQDEQDIFLYYEASSSFVQQPARVESVVETEPNLVLRIVTTGEAISAENREYYRVSTVASDLTADVGTERNCKVLDVSVTGFSIIAEGSYGIGRLLDVRLVYGETEFSGKGCVQSVRRLGDGRVRYGLLCTAGAAPDENLHRGLRQMTMNIQRQQLQRLAVVR